MTPLTPNVTRAPLWRFAEETPSGSQTQPKSQTATTQAQSVTSTPAKPSGSQMQAPAQAQSQPLASSNLLSSTTGPSESLHDEYRLLDFPESEASLIAKQARSELLDRVANFYELERGDPEVQRNVMGMIRPAYHDPARASNNLALPWYSVATEIAHLNFNIVTGKINKRMKSCNLARPWGP